MSEWTPSKSPLLRVTADDDDNENEVSQDKAELVVGDEAVRKPKDDEEDAVAEEADGEVAKDKMDVLNGVELVEEYLAFFKIYVKRTRLLVISFLHNYKNGKQSTHSLFVILTTVVKPHHFLDMRLTYA